MDVDDKLAHVMRGLKENTIIQVASQGSRAYHGELYTSWRATLVAIQQDQRTELVPIKTSPYKAPSLSDTTDETEFFDFESQGSTEEQNEMEEEFPQRS
ncbi:unnamed protein product [Umbelopsis sp. WA50703]